MAEPTGLSRFERGWRDTAVLFFNTAVLFVMVNLVIGFGFKFPNEPVPPSPIADAEWKKTSPYGRPQSGEYRSNWELQHIDMNAYDGELTADVYQMLDDMTRLSYKGVNYVPWVEYNIPEFHSQSINNEVDPANPQFTVRRSVLEPSLSVDEKSPVIDVYLFGGSTTWGWDTDDRWTVGSFLWDELQKKIQHDHPGARVRLVNYGRPLYYSSQEMLLYQRLLNTGHRPQIAIFLDGLNDTYQLSYLRDQPWYTPKLTQLLHDSQFPPPEKPQVKHSALEPYQWIPLVRMAFYLRQRYSHAPPPDPLAKISEDDAIAAPDKAADYVVKTYRANRAWARQASAAHGVQCYFFWQPGPFYDYDLQLHRTPITPTPKVLSMFKQAYEQMQQDPDEIYLGNLCQEWGHRKIFVDDVHYGPGFSRFLAQHMAKSIDLGKVQPHVAP